MASQPPALPSGAPMRLPNQPPAQPQPLPAAELAPGALTPPIPPGALAPPESVGRHLRWQVLLALAGVLILTTLLGYSALNVETVLVPAQGGAFREGVAGAPKYINPLRCDVTEIDADLCALLFRGLTRVDTDGRIVPDLAETWNYSADGLSYEFRLREGQYWDDGVPITVDDVIYTVGILQDPTVYSLPALSSLWQAIEVTRVDDRTVRFTLSEVFSPFLEYTAIGLLPKHIYETMAPVDVVNKLSTTPVGSGPMKVAEMSADHIKLAPNPFYGGRTPYLEALELRYFPDQPSIFPAFASGELEGVSRIPPEAMAEAQANAEMSVFSSALPSYLNVTLNLNNPNAPFFQDQAVRQALLYALDRERLVTEVARGQGIVAHSPVLPENWAYLETIKRYPYDPTTARALLDGAGWVDSDGNGIRDKDGRQLEFVLHTSDDPTRVALINQIAQDWAQVGVRAVPTPVTFAGLVNDLLVPRRFEAVLIGWENPGDPDPYPLWHSTQREGAGQNYGGWSNEDADLLMEQARAELNESARRQIYGDLFTIFAEEVPSLLLYYPVYSYGVSNRVSTVQVGALNHPAQRFAGFGDWFMVTKRVPEAQAAQM
ncbi:MAG: peptide ABC transporter substrate-binding protein, partial [Caldilineaceae bacterium]